MRSRSFPFFILFLVGSTAFAEPQSSFPMISQAAQRVRDNDRRFILEAELAAERQFLEKAQLALGDNPTEEGRKDVNRHSVNVGALLRELRGLGGQTAQHLPRVTVRAKRSSRNSYIGKSKTTPSFWNPYNRAVADADFSMQQREEMP